MEFQNQFNKDDDETLSDYAEIAHNSAGFRRRAPTKVPTFACFWGSSGS